MEKSEGIPANGHHRPGRKFDIGFIKMVLSEVANGLPLSEARIKYNLIGGIIRSWNRKYGTHNLPVMRRVISMQDKRTLLRAIAAGKLSVREAAATYRVGESSIHCWIKQYSEENEDLSFTNPQELNKKKIKQQPGATSEQVHQLQQQLADAQLKIAALNTLIDVAEEQLKINIRKKPGARQS